MSYLLDLVRTFTPEEMTAFRHLDVIGKGELVRDEYVHHAADKKLDESKLAAKLGLTASHFDKITSVLLDKTIAAFYGDDHNKALSTILNKGLSALVLHELKILEKKVSKQEDPPAAQQFYKAGFENLRSMFHPNYNSKLTHQFGDKYLRSLGSKKTIADESYVAMQTLYGDIVAAAYGGGETVFKPKAQKLLDTWEKKIAPHKNATADFYTAFAQATFYKHFTEDADGFLAAHERGLAAFRQSKQPIDKKYEGVVLSELGFGNMAANRFGKAQEYYADAFAKFPDTVGRSTYQATAYCWSAILNKDFAAYRHIFQLYLQPKVLPSTNRSVLFDIYILAAWAHIHLGEFDRAFDYLTILRGYRKNEITTLGHMMVRQFESAYFYLSGDIKTASITIGKNLRFLQKQGGSSVFSYYQQYTDAIDKMIKLEQGKLRFPDKLREQLNALQRGMYESCNLPLRERFEVLSAH